MRTTQPSRQTFILAGDFNNPAGQEGTILSSSLKLQDSFYFQRNRGGLYCGPGIDGWTDNRSIANRLRLFASPEWDICLHVIFDDQNKPHVSDHYG